MEQRAPATAGGLAPRISSAARPSASRSPPSPFVARVGSTSGSRTSGEHFPSTLAAYFTGPGLASTKSASCSGIRRCWAARVAFGSPSIQCACISEQMRGATFPVTEMQPWPPSTSNASTAASSPESCTKSSPQAMRVSSGRVELFDASFTPTTFGSRAHRAMVSTVMSTTERPGML